MHIFPTYGYLTRILQLLSSYQAALWILSCDSMQINFNSTLQILEAFSAFDNAKFYYLIGSLFVSLHGRVRQR
jgi:hypothetical protein